MKSKNSYTYAILRYVHDTATAEFINVGVALLCKNESFFEVKLRKTISRVSDTFPDLKAKSFRALIKNLSNRFAAVSKAYDSPMMLSEKSEQLEQVIFSVLPKDDSSLVWSPTSSGLTDNPQGTLDRLFERYISKYDHKKAAHHKTDEDIWRVFKRDLEDRRMLEFFTEKTIEGRDDEVKFPFAWKNGVWHCIEPISFDLSAPESIREKAHKYLGQITSVMDSNDAFKVYLLVSKPSEQNLLGAFDRAMNILGKMPISKEIYLEEDRNSLLDKLCSQIEDHEAPHIQ